MKRAFDLILALPGAIVTFPLVLVLAILSTIDTRAPGIYRQHRIGRHGEPFAVVKIRSMRKATGPQSTVTVLADSRITGFGAFLRRFKLDELPQLWLVVSGRMSLVGPRPDVAGYADALTGTNRAILELRPGITGPASLVFRDEERLLSSFDDPIKANDQLIWPTKIKINLAYYRAGSLSHDARLIWLTLRPNSSKLFRLLTSWDESLGDLDQVEELSRSNRDVAA